MKSHLGRGRNGGSGASIRSQKHAISWDFAGSQGDEEASFDTLGVSAPQHPHISVLHFRCVGTTLLWFVYVDRN